MVVLVPGRELHAGEQSLRRNASLLELLHKVPALAEVLHEIHHGRAHESQRGVMPGYAVSYALEQTMKDAESSRMRGAS